MNFGGWQGENRSDTSGIARIFNGASRQKGRDFCYRLMGHHTRPTRNEPGLYRTARPRRLCVVSSEMLLVLHDTVAAPYLQDKNGVRRESICDIYEPLK